MLNCAEQVQVHKYKTHAYKTPQTAGVQTIMLKHPNKQLKMSSLTPTCTTSFKIGDSEMGPCYANIMTVEHLLQHCPLHDAMRRDVWPEPTPLRDKLYSNLEELRRTAAFVRATGISI